MNKPVNESVAGEYESFIYEVEGKLDNATAYLQTLQQDEDGRNGDKINTVYALENALWEFDEAISGDDQSLVDNLGGLEVVKKLLRIEYGDKVAEMCFSAIENAIEY